jgi:hypothetical protein
MIIPKKLQWKYVAHEKLWIGTLQNNYSVRFELHEQIDGKYLMKSNLDGIRKLIVRDLHNAKMMAQENFNTYAFGLLSLEN